MILCSADSPPWTIKTGDSPSKIKGLAVDLMSELFRRADMQIQMVALPFKRCLKETKDGTLDGCFMTIKNTERESYAEFSDAYLAIPTYVYYSLDRLDRFEWDVWEDFKAYTIGVQRGFKYGQAFTNALERVPLKIVEFSDVNKGIEMIRSGRIDLILINEYRLNYLLMRCPEHQHRLARAQKPVATGLVYIAISKRSPNVSIIPKLNEILAEMESDGTIDRIVHPSSRR